ncbi:MAG: GNAT family N-acetyltransferase [Dehalococcoidales bacterium]|nr:MAG: GNAT family N-acetyltransferase [Dehalococcoidales bacterium]
MTGHPILETERLILKPFKLADAPEVQRLVGDRDVASTTINIPHPYEDGMAEEWIAAYQDRFDKGEQVRFAITHGKEGYLIGAIDLWAINTQHEKAEIGYWTGKPYWNLGYCTEAARAVLKHGFIILGLNRIYATHFTRNPASGRVMQKIGMKHEGHLRQHAKKWGNYEDFETYAILRSEYETSTG